MMMKDPAMLKEVLRVQVGPPRPPGAILRKGLRQEEGGQPLPWSTQNDEVIEWNQFLKDGRSSGRPLEGVDFLTSSKLSAGHCTNLNLLMNKQRAGTLITGEDAQQLIELRKAARRPERASPNERLQQSIRDLKEIFPVIVQGIRLNA